MKRIPLLLITIILCLYVKAQERIITGKVTAFQTIPLNNIKVISKKSGSETFTNEKGNFKIKCIDDDVLTFYSHGFQDLKRKIKNGKDSINVNLFFVDSKKNKELSVENGHINSNVLEYSLNNLPNPSKDYSKYIDIYELLKAEFPYLGIIGNAITIGVPTSFTFDPDALLVVDGTYVKDISFIQPIYVISVKVVKGSEASIYGMRGTNGVIIIETFRKR